MLKLQLDDDGYNAFSNQELAQLLDTTVADIENRKKRVKTRLLRIQRRQSEGAQTMPKRDTEHLFDEIRQMADVSPKGTTGKRPHNSRRSTAFWH